MKKLQTLVQALGAVKESALSVMSDEEFTAAMARLEQDKQDARKEVSEKLEEIQNAKES